MQKLSNCLISIIQNLLMFGPKHRLRYSLEQPQRRSMFLGKILKISIFPGEIMNFYMSKMSVYCMGKLSHRRLKL